MSLISHPSKIEFPISLILKRPYILWSRPFQVVNPKVMVSYINLDFWPTLKPVKTTSPSCNQLVPENSALSPVFPSSSANFRNQGSLSIFGHIHHQHPMASKKRIMKMATDKSCWTCKYLGNWTGDTFIQDFICTWFSRHGKGEKTYVEPQE